MHVLYFLVDGSLQADVYIQLMLFPHSARLLALLLYSRDNGMKFKHLYSMLLIEDMASCITAQRCQL